MKARYSPALVSVVLALVVGAVLVGIVFGTSLGAPANDPVDFEETVAFGLSYEAQFTLEDRDDAIELPRVQAFYSQYPFVVGYHGIGRFLEATSQPGHDRQFGYPLDVYVTTYDHGPLDMTDEGYPVFEGEAHWYPAEDAHYVADTGFRTPHGEAIIPFATHTQAAQTAEEYGGEVLTWEAVTERSFGIDDATTVRDRTDAQLADADALVAELGALAERDETRTVGEDGDTIQSTIDAAPPNATVVVPTGTYEEAIEIDKPLTLVGDDATTIDGGGNGSVVTVSADGVAIRSVDIVGVGDDIRLTIDHDAPVADDPGWDQNIEEMYARSDAGIRVTNASDVLIEEVGIDSPAAGIVLVDADPVVVSELAYVGNEVPVDGHMGVVAMRSSGVIQDSTVEQGRDGLYLHRAGGIVVRNNTLADNRIGLHLMYTSDAVIADNDAAGQDSAGIYVMTGPERNSVVGNEIGDTWLGLYVGGSDSYVADNVITDTEIGLRLDASTTLVERNRFVDNAIGVLPLAMLPSNTVTANDFVANDRHVGESTGPLRIWTDGHDGNYWEGAVGWAENDTLDRAYRATDTVDGRLHQVDGARLLAHAPGTIVLSGIEEAIAGMQDGAVIDVAPRCEPVHPEWLASQGHDRLDPHCFDSDPTDTHP